MRRHDREITERSEIDAVLHGALVCHLALARDGEPYVVPLSFGYDGRCLYLHTAAAGRKIDFLEANSRVCFQVEREVRLVPRPQDPCRWTFTFETVIGYGRVTELLTPEEKARGLNEIVRHYGGRSGALPPREITPTRVWRVAVESLTGKRAAAESGKHNSGKEDK